MNLQMPDGLQMIIPLSRLDLHSRIDAFEGAIVVDISDQPSEIIRRLDIQFDYSGNSKIVLGPFTNYFSANRYQTEIENASCSEMNSLVSFSAII